MNDNSDSEDSAFLFTTNFSTRKADTNNDETKKAISADELQGNEINLNEETMYTEAGSLTVERNCSTFNNNAIQTEFGKETFEKCMVVDVGSTVINENNIQHKSKLICSKITDYYSCPLCLKTFDTEIVHISHMKQCAKKSKMTPKQLLQALEIHKDQLKKRVHSGLSSLSPLKKKKKTRNQDNLGSTYELALGLALSKSLTELNPNHLGSNNSSFKNNMKNNKTTLESFGFTTSNCNFGGTGRKKLKNWKNTQFVLRERTKEQRERLITEKAAVILLCKDYEVESYKKPGRMGSCDLEHENIRENEEKESLWKLGENEDNTNWYVQNIKYFMLEEEGECVTGENTRNSEDWELLREVKSLNLPRISVFQDWRKLVNNRHLSDLNFRSKSSETFYLHSVVLYVRCPTMLDLDLQSVFGGFSAVTILSFLQYLYCGVLDGLKRSEVENLFDLAKSVNFEELLQVLSILKKNLNLKCSERDGTTPELSKALCQKEENVGNNLDENIKLQNSSHHKELLEIHSQVSDSNSSNSLQESVRQNCDIEVVTNESNQEFLKSSENKEEALWEPDEIENLSNHMRTEEQFHVALNGKKDENVLHSINKKLSLNDELSNKCGEIADLEGDMFEEVDIISQSSNTSKSFNISSPHYEVNMNKSILVLSESSKDGFSNEEGREEVNEKNEEFPVTDCEIPYFDPYEHFNTEIPLPDSPLMNEEQILRSQSLFLNEISPVKLSSPRPTNSPHDKSNIFPELETVSPIAIPSTSQASDFCSTPIISVNTSKPTSNGNKSNRKYLKRRQKRKSQSLCFKRNSSVIASRLRKTKVFRSSSVKKRRSISKDVKNDEEDPSKEADILTESILKNFDNSFGMASGKSPETHIRKFIEVTPAATGEEFTEEVSPLPDYSVMNASGIKKHLTKYGLKKSLSKNKAKKILRHIYEELHPLINTGNGKIIKYEPMEKRKQCRKKSERKKRKSLKDKTLQIVKEKSTNETGVRETSCKNPGEDSYSTVTRSEAEDVGSPFDDANNLERSEQDIFERSDSEIQESQSQTTFSSAKDVTEAIFDFIHSNSEIHRRILMYEPIWLENFREQLYQKYNKKFKLTDLMDCLDAECITFRCESQRRTNRTRKIKRTKSSHLKNK